MAVKPGGRSGRTVVPLARPTMREPAETAPVLLKSAGPPLSDEQSIAVGALDAALGRFSAFLL